MREAEHGGVHGAGDGEDAGVNGWRERTYADAYTEGWCDADGWTADADANRWAVDGGLLVLFDDDLVLSGGSTDGRGVERGWRRIAVDVWVVGDVGVVGRC